MAVDKNFVVKNGLEVNTDLILANAVTNQVGIATTVTKYTLHVNGGIGATNLSVTGVSTFSQVVLSGTVSAGSTIGLTGQYLKSTGTGVAWESFPVGRTSTTFTASASQNTFNFTYAVGLVDVFVNGIKLTPVEFTASDGVTIVLSSPCFGGEIVDIHAYSVSGLGVGATGITGLTIQDEGILIGNPQGVTSINFIGAAITAAASGAGLTISHVDKWGQTSAGISTTLNVGLGTTNPRFSLEVGPVGYADTALWVNGNARITGILTVGTSSIVLDGNNNTLTVPNLVVTNSTTGVTASGAGVTVRDGGGNLGSASIIDFGDNLSVTFSSGIATITGSAGGGSSSQWVSTSSGIHTTSNVGIGTTNATSALTVSGSATFSNNITVSGIAGATQFAVGQKTNLSEITSGNYSNTINVGNDLLVYHLNDPVHGRFNYIQSDEYDLYLGTRGETGGSYNYAFLVGIHTGNDAYNPNTSYVTLRYGNSDIKLQTLGVGVTVTGTTFTNQLSVSGVSTFIGSVGIGTTNPGEKLQVDGNIRVGISTTSNYIAFRGTTFDGPLNVGGELPYQHTYIGERIYDYSGSEAERSELLLFKGNDTAGVAGPDRIRLFAGEHRFDVLGFNTTGTFEQVGVSTAAVNKLTITSTGVGIGTTNPTSALTVKGNTSLETLNVSGVSTFQNNVNLLDDDRLYFGTDQDIFIGHQTIPSPINYIAGANNVPLTIWADNLTLGAQNGENFATFTTNGSASLYYDNSKKFETLGTGVTVTGTTFTDQLSVSGIATIGTGVTIYGNTGIVSATTFYGNVVGNITGSITDATNLTGGTANASSLNVSGVATISQGRIQVDASSNIRLGNLPAGSGSGRNIAIGDQVLYSLSGGQGRNIGIGELSYYDTTTGQYNIGIGERAGQKVSTGSYNVILGAYDGNSGNLDIRTLSNNVVIADGQGNIRQYINSSGNVGIKTTVVTEALTVAGIVSATGFYGTLNASQLTGTLPAIDGSALINVVGSGSGVVIQDDATPIGTAGTINFGSNISVSFASGIATVSASIPGINTSGTSTFNQLNVSGVSTFTNNINLNTGNLKVATDGIIKIGNSDQLELYYNGSNGQTIKSTGDLRILTNRLLLNNSANDEQLIEANQNGSVTLYYDNSKKFETLGTGVTVTGTTFTNQLSISGNTNSSGIITASSFSGSGSGLTNLPAGQLTGSLPAIDGSALLNVTAAGTGVAVKDDGSAVGSATTIDFGTGLDVTFSAGIATITASGGSLQSRTTVTGVTTSIANNGIGNTNINGFKSYALMKVGLSTAGWLRLYTDSASRTADASRSQGIDPAPGSGVIAEVITTGISTTQIISPFVMGGNLDNPADTTIYAAITNLSGTTQTITANLTILQLEA